MFVTTELRKASAQERDAARRASRDPRDAGVDLLVAEAISLVVREVPPKDARNRLVAVADEDPDLLQAALDRCLASTVVDTRTARRAARQLQRARYSLSAKRLRPSA